MENFKTQIHEIIKMASTNGKNYKSNLQKKSATEVAIDIGIADPSKGTLNLIAKTLRNAGLREGRNNIKQYFECEDWDALYRSWDVANTGHTTPPKTSC